MLRETSGPRQVDEELTYARAAYSLQGVYVWQLEAPNVYKPRSNVPSASREPSLRFPSMQMNLLSCYKIGPLRGKSLGSDWREFASCAAVRKFVSGGSLNHRLHILGQLALLLMALSIKSVPRRHAIRMPSRLSYAGLP